MNISLPTNLILIATVLTLSASGAEPAAAPTAPTDVSLVSAAVPLAATSSSAAAPIPPPSSAPATPSQNVTVNLINRLVQRGLLPKEDADELIKQAENDAVVARAQAQADAESAAAQAVAQSQVQNGPDPVGANDDAVRVTYVPEVVKAQIRDQIKDEVMNQAREENWAQPRKLPAWVTRFRFMGDVRVRYEGDFFPSGNDNSGAFPNFNAINTGSPFDVTGTQFPSQLNVDKDRHRFRLRLRLGAEADLGNGFTVGLRIATGENNTPTSTNQSLGLANQAQGGNFSKYAIWLDRGYLKWEAGGEPGRDFSLTLGRFDNPFFRTSELTWDDDLGFDGVAMQGRYEVVRGLTPFAVAGAFPVFNTDFNFSSNQPAKFKSSDKYLYGGQIGAEWRINKDLSAKAAVAYYYFDDVAGKLSRPFIPLSASDQGNTDDTRPSFAQKGNSYMALRRIIPSPLNNFGASNQFQYFGLVTPFHELNVAGQIDYKHFEPIVATLYGEWTKNLAFDRSRADMLAVNNRTSGGTGAFDGGDNAWIAGLKLGSVSFQKLWDWNLGVNYRRIESDAVVDGFNDSDFGLGGTNLKGYTVFGNLALNQNVWLGLRWMSANQIAGPPFRADVLQFDVNGKF